MTHCPSRAVYLVTPHAGGTFAVFLSLRAALASQNITLDFLGYSENPETLAADPALAPALSFGHLIDSRGLSQQQIGQALLQKILALDYPLVFINVLTSPAEMAIAAYLPDSIKRIMIVHSITPGTYDGARAVLPFVHAAVGVCPRNRDHLVTALGSPADRTFCVPNAVHIEPFQSLPHSPRSELARILFLGRIVEVDKGVFWLPEIMKRLAGPYRLTIAGDGPDLEILKRRCAPLGDALQFLGRVPSSQIPQLVASHDLFLMTSRFEGLPVALVEAMAGGCVPVASRITGVTDFVITHGQTGFLFPVGDCKRAVAAIRSLASAETQRQQMAAAGRADAQQRFSILAMSAGYAQVLDSLDSAPTLTSLPAGPLKLLQIKGGWRKLIPPALKNLLRKWHYRRS